MGCKGLRGEQPQLRRPKRLMDVARGFSLISPLFFSRSPRPPPTTPRLLESYPRSDA